MTACVSCANDTKVVDSRKDFRGWQWRRRVCLSCALRFNTYEVPDSLLTFDDPVPAPEPEES